MPAPSPLGASIKEALDAAPGVTEHPSGHSDYLLRYVAPGGGSFAVGRTEINAVRFWVLDNDGFREGATLAGHAVEASIPKPRGASGRNSNLDQIPEFKRQPLLWARAASPAEALTLVGILVAALTPTVGEAEPQPETEAPQPPAAEPAPEAQPEAVTASPVEAASAAPELPAPEPAQAAIEAPAPPTAEPVAPAPAEPVAATVPAALAPASAAPRRSLIGRLLGGILGRGRKRA